MSVKVQVTVPESLLAQMKAESRRLKISIPELMRRTMQDRLPQRSHQRRQGNKVGYLESITGLIADCEDTDLASRVDEIYD